MSSALAQIPLAVGASAATLAARGFSWTAAQFSRSPMGATGVVLMSGLTLMAATNALYMQDGRHPAPMFGINYQQPAQIEPVVVEPQSVPQRPAAEPVAERTAPGNQPMPDPIETAASPEPTQPAIGNQDIADMQEKLSDMGLFEGTVDGYYGPRTADAIRAFEARFNLPRTGAATPQLIQAVREAPLEAPQPVSSSVAAEPSSDDIAPLIAQMEQTAQTPAASPERQTVADISPDLPAAAPTPAPVPEPAVTAQPAPSDVPAVLDRDLVSDIQRGLNRLGFLQGPVNGVADEATARAIRQFQIFNNYRPTGEVSPVLRQMLVEAGAYM